MNHVYRLIWNRALGAWVVACEFARSRGKGRSPARAGTGHLRLLVLLPLSAWASLGWAAALPPGNAPSVGSVGSVGSQHGASTSQPPSPPPATRLPSGGTISAGSGSIGQAGSSMTITQQSQHLAIDWQGFDIGRDASVTFLQPNSSAIALNRVLGADGTRIFGQLNANGQVWVINPNGVLFGSDAQVSAGGLVASTLGLSNADFLAGKRTFGGNGGAVDNQGRIDAGYVALLGGQVSNEGVIVANLGTATLAAGNRITLDFSGDNLLSVQVDEGALQAQVDNKGLLQADGGTVLMTAKAKDALLDTVVNNHGIVRARTIENRNGRILLLGDMDSGTVNVTGTLDASAPDGGNGGFIETSAAHVKVADGAVITTKAVNGQSGTWLIDPVDFTIAASGGDMTGAALTSALTNGDVEIQSTAGASGVNGDINVKDTVSWSQNTLTLNAQRDINIFNAMNASGTAGLFFKYGQADAGGSYNIQAPVNLASTGSFRTQSGSAGAVTNWTIITSLGAAGSTTGTDLQGMNGDLSGNYVLGADIDASATASWNGGAGFTSIGNSSNAFTGDFDGLGHAIDGLTIKAAGAGNFGLFGAAFNASIANIGLSHVAISGGAVAGGLVGQSSNVTIYNSYVTGSVSAYGVAGGLVGTDIIPRGSTRLINVYSTADVTATTPGTGASTLSGIAGGLIGDNVGLIENSYATGHVTGGNYVGGLVGRTAQSTIRNSYFGGTVTVNGTPYTRGAISGGAINNLALTLENVYWNTDTVGSLSVAGNANLVNPVNVAGLTTAQMRNAANWTGFDFTTTPGSTGWVLLDGVLPMLASEWSPVIHNAHQLQLMALDLSANYTLANDIDASATDGKDVWLGSSFSPVGNGSSAFTGSFDGQNHVIDGLTINRLGADGVGLFGYASAASLGSVGLSNANVQGRNYVGILLGRGEGGTNIDNAWSSGTVFSNSTQSNLGGAGGLAGWQVGIVSNSHSSADVEGYASVGGLVGILHAGNDSTIPTQITHSHATGDVRAAVGAGGGLVGISNGRVDNSYATGDVSGGRSLGGLVGIARVSDYWTNAQSGNIYLQDLYNINYATGDVTGNQSVLGTGTQQNAYGNYIGGLIGEMQGFVTVGNSFATGNVSGYNGVGGLVGYIPPHGGGHIHSVKLLNTYAAGGTVTGNDWVGGLVGLVDGYVGIQQSYSASGLLTGTAANAKVGGLFGWQTTNAALISVVSAVWNRETTGTDHASGGDFLGSVMSFPGYITGEEYLTGCFACIGATTDQMMTLEPYYIAQFYGGGTNSGLSILTDGTAAGRSFIENDEVYGRLYHVFRMYEGNTYPLLMAFLKTATVSADLSGRNKTYDGHIASGTVGSYTTDVAVAAGKILGTLNYATNSANAGTYSTVNGGLDVSGGLYSGQFGYNILYSPATSLTIAKASATATANSGTFTYNGQAQSVAGYTVTGLVNGEDESVIDALAEAGGSGRNAGSYAHTVSGSDNNYDLTFVDGALTIDKAAITISTDDVTKTYDGTLDAAGNAIVLGGQLFSSDTLGGGSFAFTDKNAGTGKTVTVAGVTIADGNNGDNYNVTYAANTRSTIEKASLTVSSSDVSKVYDGTTTAAGTAIITGGTLFDDDQLSGGSFAFTDANAGSDKTVTVAGVTIADGNNGDNYNVTYAANTRSTIDKASLVISSGDVSKVYDGTTTAAGTAIATDGTRLFGTDSLSGGSFAFTDANAGEGKTVTVSGVTVNDGNGGGNYNIAYVDNTDSTINRKTLTFGGATVADKIYDGTTTAMLTGVGPLSGLVAGENLVLDTSGALARFSDKNAGSGKAVTISGLALVDGSNGLASNYTLSTTSVSTLASIFAKALTGHFGAADKTYDGSTDAAVTGSLAGVVNGDEVTLAGTGHFADKNAGNGKAVTVSGGLTGSDAGNYTVSFDSSALASIFAKAIRVTANDQSKYAWQNDPALDFTIGEGSLVDGDTVDTVFSGSLAREPGNRFGDYAIMQGSLQSNGNYRVDFTPGTFHILGSRPEGYAGVVASAWSVFNEDGYGDADSGAAATISDEPTPPLYRIVNSGMRLPEGI